MKICFVAQQIYPFLSQNTSILTAGGAELQQKFIGEGLQARGYDISYISLDYGQKKEEHISGLTIYKSFKPHEGIFGIRFFYPRLFKLWKALEKADADMYYVRSATYLPGVVSIFSKKNKKVFVFAGAHDTNFTPANLRLPTKRDEFLYKYGLKNADAIIVQSEKQKCLLKKNFGKEGNVIRNFYPFWPKKISLAERKIILWVATIKSWKRPEQFVRLAEKFPSEHFVMIGGRPSIGNKNLYESIQENSKRVMNLKFLGFQPFEITERYFDQCKLFVNTSKYEGFPNTFLQAWNRGIPVMSYVDPDEVIQQNNLGFVVRSENDMQNALSSFLSMNGWNPDPIINYFNNNHSQKIVEKYDMFFKGIMKNKDILINPA